MLTSIFSWITNTAQNGIDNTFGQMNGKEIFWTIIALLALYQLVMIKWRLIDQNRRSNVPSSYLPGLVRRFTPMRTSTEARHQTYPPINERTDEFVTPPKTAEMLDSDRPDFLSDLPVIPDSEKNRFVPHLTDRVVMQGVSAEVFPSGRIEVRSHPEASTNKSSSQAGLQSFVPMLPIPVKQEDSDLIEGESSFIARARKTRVSETNADFRPTQFPEIDPTDPGLIN